MLTDEKIQAITLLIENKHNKTDIADMCGIHRTTLYNWLGDSKFKTELDKRLLEIQTYGMNQIKANLSKCINNLVLLANTSESEKIKLDANEYLIDRILGKTTTKIDLEAVAKYQGQEIDDNTIEAEIEEMNDLCLMNNIQGNNE